MDKRRSRLDLEEGISVLSKGRQDMGASEEAERRPGEEVVAKEEQSMLLLEFHVSPWSRHRGSWARFEKLKERYWCLGMYHDMHHFVTMFEDYQMHSEIRHCDDLHPTYGACTRRSDESGGEPSPTEQDYYRRVSVPN